MSGSSGKSRASPSASSALNTDDVAIIGGGIGGLTLALMLQQAGLSCSVYEAAPEIRSPAASTAEPSSAADAIPRDRCSGFDTMKR